MDPLSEAKALLQHVAEGFVLVDQEFRVLEMNAEGERIEGRPSSELIGTSLWNSWPDLKDSELGRLWREAMHTRVPVALEHHYSWPDGRDAWLAMRAFPSESGLAIFYRDITDRKRSEEALLTVEASLLHASRLSAMGTMAAMLSHELNQPLTAVTNYLEAAQRLARPIAPEQSKELRRALASALDATNRVSEVIARLRTFVISGRIEPEIHDIQGVVADACVLAMPHVREAGVQFQFDLDRAAKWVSVDDVQIQQVLLNLVRNAIDAMRASDRKIITLRTRRVAGQFVEVAVEDTGEGVGEPGEDIFAPLVGAKEQGMGLGLSISRAIVEAHGGTLAAENSLEGGAVFRFTLPTANFDAARGVGARERAH